MSLVIKNVDIIGKDGIWDVLVEDGEIRSISKDEDGDEILNAEGKYLSPGFVNTHTHAAMSLLRGYADDMPLQKWLQEEIWPVEARLNEDYVYWGTKLACLEMIKTGTVAFNDMYFFMESTAKAVSEMGMKAVLSYGMIDLGDEKKRISEIEKTEDFIEDLERYSNIQPALGPHAVYTASKEMLGWCAEKSTDEDLLVNLHLAETENELKDFKQDNDISLTGYLKEVGLLNERLIAAHSVWLENGDFVNLGQNKVTVSHNPTSNMKLGVGKPMNYSKLKENDVKVTIGTDGCASNNNLDMLEEAKMAAVQQKMHGHPTRLPADEAYEMITKYGAEALKTDGGVIKEGKAADLILIEKGVTSIPGHNPISDIIYSMSGSDVTDVIIDGKIVMRNRYVDGEEEIMKTAKSKAMELVSGK
ncbi:MAG: amidohydrolase family protein [Candidatus Saliniplasma sp.]